MELIDATDFVRRLVTSQDDEAGRPTIDTEALIMELRERAGHYWLPPHRELPTSFPYKRLDLVMAPSGGTLMHPGMPMLVLDICPDAAPTFLIEYEVGMRPQLRLLAHHDGRYVAFWTECGSVRPYTKEI